LFTVQLYSVQKIKSSFLIEFYFEKSEKRVEINGNKLETHSVRLEAKLDNVWNWINQLRFGVNYQDRQNLA